MVLPTRLLTLLLAVAVGFSYGVPCLPGAERGTPDRVSSNAGVVQHDHAAPSSDATARTSAHAHHRTQTAGSHHAPPTDCEEQVGAPCPCGCGEGSGPAGISARPGPALRIAIATLPAAEEMTPSLDGAPRPSPAPVLGIDHVPI